eukprot:scaffold2113_cov233-Pinguiococcus_pyrenoidosus.AAC.26
MGFPAAEDGQSGEVLVSTFGTPRTPRLASSYPLRRRVSIPRAVGAVPTAYAQRPIPRRPGMDARETVAVRRHFLLAGGLRDVLLFFRIFIGELGAQVGVGRRLLAQARELGVVHVDSGVQQRGLHAGV